MFCIVCTVFLYCFVYVYLLLFVLSVLVQGLLQPSDNSTVVSTHNMKKNNVIHNYKCFLLAIRYVSHRIRVC